VRRRDETADDISHDDHHNPGPRPLPIIVTAAGDRRIVENLERPDDRLLDPVSIVSDIRVLQQDVAKPCPIVEDDRAPEGVK
jgi:hypothetical protein